MTENKRFMEFATQRTDNGEIINGFHDIKTNEWYYTKDSKNAKNICELLNELIVESDLFKLKVARAIQHRINYLKKQSWNNAERIDELISLKKELEE